MEKVKFSIIIPAHNEEEYIEKCLRSVQKAARAVSPHRVQVIVVANRCTDKTVAIARKCKAGVVLNHDKCLSSIRNAGARYAKGEILVTLDADSCMTPDSLCEILTLLESGRYIGGGAMPVFDRSSLGIAVSSLYILAHLLPEMLRERALLSGTMFWCYRRDFEAIGGFDESLCSMEDMDFAKRLHRFGAERGLRYGTLKQSSVVTSSRKFDEFGDWHLIRNSALTKAIFTGKDRSAANSYYYDVR